MKMSKNFCYPFLLFHFLFFIMYSPSMNLLSTNYMFHFICLCVHQLGVSNNVYRYLCLEAIAACGKWMVMYISVSFFFPAIFPLSESILTLTWVQNTKAIIDRYCVRYPTNKTTKITSHSIRLLLCVNIANTQRRRDPFGRGKL